MSGEHETAFYKGVKFWFALLLAALLAWLLLSHWSAETSTPSEAVQAQTVQAQTVSNIR